MRILMVAAAVVAVGFALPAFAQGNNGKMNQSYNPGFSQPQSQGNNGQNFQRQNVTSAQLRQQIYQDLKQGGFTDIHIVPGSFVVHARDPNGNPVAMLITPNSMAAVTAVPQGRNGTHQGQQFGLNQPGNQSWSGPMGQNGMSNSAHSGNTNYNQQ
jgi:hypothetical protein